MNTKTGTQNEIAENMKAASALWEIPVATLKIAKSKGCQAFKAQRIHRTPLMKWLKENAEIVKEGESSAASAHELKRQKTQAEVELLRAKLSRERTEVVNLDEARVETARGMAIGLATAAEFLEPDLFNAMRGRIASRIGTIFEIPFDRMIDAVQDYLPQTSESHHHSSIFPTPIQSTHDRQTEKTSDKIRQPQIEAAGGQ